MRKQQPYCTIERQELDQIYKVYDHTGSLMCYTKSRAAAAWYLDLANKGISARMYHYLELWKWRVPKRYLDQH